MSRFVAALVFGLLPPILAACMAGDPDPDTKPAGKLYQCLGTPPYDENAWEEIERQALADLAAHPGKCRPRDSALAVMASLSRDPDRGTMPGDSLRIRSVVLDAGCGLFREASAALAAGSGPADAIPLWDGRDAHGRPAPTGEYYVNVEIGWSDGRKDTSWHKVGYIQTACAP